MSEWEVLRNLEPIEQLLHNIAEGPDLDLHLDDEFPPILKNPCFRTVAQNSHTYKLFQSLDGLRRTLELVPPKHLSPRVQALYRVCLMPTLDPMRGQQPSEPAVDKAWRAAKKEKYCTPSEPLDYLHASILGMPLIDKMDAVNLIEALRPYYNCLKAVLKNPDLKRAQSYRINRARKHHQRLTSLFKATRKSYSEVLQIYLELTVRPPLARIGADPERYALLSQARAKFLKGRQDNPLFHGLIGYAWKYRYTYDQGLVCMMVLLFDYEVQPQRHSLTNALTQWWLSVAPKGSQCRSPSADAGYKSFQYYGHLNCEDKAVEDGFAALARVMGLYDAYVKPKAPKQLHVFDASKPPGTKPRPRKRQSKRRPVAKS